MDIIPKERRSWNMSRIRARNTKPERIVRSVLHRQGARFRLHRKDLPGCPDIILPRYLLVIFVHGCFWHRHNGCKYTYTPKSRVEFWKDKFERNVRRDTQAREELKNLGWSVGIVWECETRDTESIAIRIAALLSEHHRLGVDL